MRTVAALLFATACTSAAAPVPRPTPPSPAPATSREAASETVPGPYRRLTVELDRSRFDVVVERAAVERSARDAYVVLHLLVGDRSAEPGATRRAAPVDFLTVTVPRAVVRGICVRDATTPADRCTLRLAANGAASFAPGTAPRTWRLRVVSPALAPALRVESVRLAYHGATSPPGARTGRLHVRRAPTPSESTDVPAGFFQLFDGEVYLGADTRFGSRGSEVVAEDGRTVVVEYRRVESRDDTTAVVLDRARVRFRLVDGRLRRLDPLPSWVA